MEDSKSSGMKILGWVIIAILVLWGIFAFANKGGAPKETGPIRIGVIAPLTGDAAAYGEPALNIYKLAVAEINAAGGVDGRPLELVVEDGKCTGAVGTSAAQKLVNVDKVQVIIGGICSGETIPAVSVAEAGKVLMISPGASSPDLTGKSQYFVRINPSDSAQGKILANLAASQGAKTIYMVVEQTDYAKGIAKVFEDTFVASGGQVTKEEFASNVTDVRQMISKAKNANPDIFFVSPQTPANAQKVFKAMRDLKWAPKLFVNDVVPGDPGTMTAYKDVLNGAYTAEIGIDPENATLKHALELYKTTYGSDMPYQNYGQTEWDVTFLVRDGLKAVGNNGEKLSKWFRTVKDWQGASGAVTIGENGDPILGHKAEMIKDGKKELVK